MTIDKERLVRLLRMTESDQDAEALIAIRKSNDLLRAHRTSWADVIDLPPPEDPQFGRPTDWSPVFLPGY